MVSVDSSIYLYIFQCNTREKLGQLLEFKTVGDFQGRLEWLFSTIFAEKLTFKLLIYYAEGITVAFLQGLYCRKGL